MLYIVKHPTPNSANKRFITMSIGRRTFGIGGNGLNFIIRPAVRISAAQLVHGVISISPSQSISLCTIIPRLVRILKVPKTGGLGRLPSDLIPCDRATFQQPLPKACPNAFFSSPIWAASCACALSRLANMKAAAPALGRYNRNTVARTWGSVLRAVSGQGWWLTGCAVPHRVDHPCLAGGWGLKRAGRCPSSLLREGE